MSELRQNIITRDWVIIATERAKRPDQFAIKREEQIILPHYHPHCPFCLGNEEDIKLESFRISDDHGWKVRVIPNKYPALSPLGERVRFSDNIHRGLSGVGFHDVIVEHPRHDLTTALLSVEDIADILFAYRHRYSQIRQDPRIETIIIFKNHGESAGTSLEHPHSQLAATPVVPFQFRSRIDDAIRFFDDTGDCLFCRTIQDELTENTRIILETEYFVAFIPYAALSPFHTWIFPRRHTSSFHRITDFEIFDLAYMMKMILAKLYYGLNNPDYNYTIRSSPIAEGETKYFHWYIAIVPRVTRQAGFELGSGMYINTALPEESAEFLRTFPLPLSHP
ncbi:MAG: galactose-1-phosphate uridylyltransferase [Microcoleaceae cyanobacterium]